MNPPRLTFVPWSRCRRGAPLLAFAASFAYVCIACATGQRDSVPPSTGKNASNGAAGAAPAPTTESATAATADGGERRVAGSMAEATALISAAIESRQSDIVRCVGAFRARRKLAHEKVAVAFGIDQEGRLLGVTSKGKEDTELKACVKDALTTASFPRSHAGIITVTKTYEEITK